MSGTSLLSGLILAPYYIDIDREASEERVKLRALVGRRVKGEVVSIYHFIVAGAQLYKLTNQVEGFSRDPFYLANPR